MRLATGQTPTQPARSLDRLQLALKVIVPGQAKDLEPNLRLSQQPSADFSDNSIDP